MILRRIFDLYRYKRGIISYTDLLERAEHNQFDLHAILV